MSRRFVYVGFWARVAASLIDGLVGMALLPITIPLSIYAYGHRTMLPPVALAVVTAALWTWLVVRFGATPGKWAIGARVVSAEGRFLSWGAAFRRYAVPSLLLQANSLLQQARVMRSAPAPTDLGGLLKMGAAARKYGEPFGTFAYVLVTIAIVDVLVVAFNRKKRAIHDFIAGSYVVEKSSLRGEDEPPPIPRRR